ncbi:MAG: UDP-N-acetylmuramate--L-alanine ligase [Candidatus Omnitrophica bacterium]|nr:UDP-N-acetylmuramate--L-alanine ligase [Candidatus Omnitrophota bacterium]
MSADRLEIYGKRVKNIHFIGIGGIGMSALAKIYLSKGHIITGSDLRLNDLTDELKRLGSVIFEGHDALNVPPDTDIAVRSSCIGNDNPEILQAKKLGVKIISRGELLRMIILEHDLSVGITGTHGKTTTTSIISHILHICGKTPTVIIGGEVELFNGNAKLGGGWIAVAEIDESDGYFRNIRPKCAVVTNIEREHIEHYGSMENLTEAYKEFARGISKDGFFVFNGEDPILRSFREELRARTISFGLDGEFDVSAKHVKFDKFIEFELNAKGARSRRFTSSLIGRYNLMNILAAVSVCLEIGLSSAEIASALDSFSGVKRRFDIIGTAKGVKVVEDYAHHPTELNSVITAARRYNTSGRIISVFQPHRYSRTKDLKREFSNCFYSSDILVLTDIYSADESAAEEIKIENICRDMDKTRFEKVVFLRKKDIPEFIRETAKQDDMVLVLGAGDIREVSGKIIDRIRRGTLHVPSCGRLI